MDKFSQYRLLVMTKSPELGRVKTRMQPFLTPIESAQLHTSLVQYVLSLWNRADLCPIDLWVGGDIDLFEQSVLPFENMPMNQQCDGNLGDKMAYAVKTSLSHESVNGVVLVGTDCPFIDADYLQEALLSMETHDVVIGPANDGGYVLLGIKSDLPELFADIDWSTEHVCSMTLDKIHQLNITVKMLDKVSDIDNRQDLLLLDHEHFPVSLQYFGQKEQ